MYSYTNISAILWFRRDIQSLGLLRNVCIRLRSENFGVIFLWNLKIKYWKLSKRIIRLYFMYDKLTLWHARHFAVKLRISHEYSLQILIPRCPAHRGFWLRGVQLIVNSDSTVSWSLQIQTPHCAAHRGFWLRSPSWILTPRCPAQRRFWLWGVLFIADTDSALSFSFRSRKTHSYRKHTWITLIYPFVLRYS